MESGSREMVHLYQRSTKLENDNFPLQAVKLPRGSKGYTVFQVMDDLLSIETDVVGDTPDTANTLAARTAPVTSYAAR